MGPLLPQIVPKLLASLDAEDAIEIDDGGPKSGLAAVAAALSKGDAAGEGGEGGEDEEEDDDDDDDDDENGPTFSVSAPLDFARGPMRRPPATTCGWLPCARARVRVLLTRAGGAGGAVGRAAGANRSAR